MRELFARFDVLRERRHDAFVPGEVFHELARQLHGVPFNAVDAGNGFFRLRCEHVVKRMPKLVKKRRHVVVREGRFAAVDARSEVADEVGNRQFKTVLRHAAGAVGIHPGARALAGTSVQVRVEIGDVLAVFRQREELHVGVPGASIALFDADAVERFGKMEKPRKDGRLREVALHDVGRIAVAALAKRFGDVGLIPAFHFFEAEGLRVFAKGFHVLHGEGLGVMREVAKEIRDFLRGRGHLDGQGGFRVVRKPEELGFFVAKREDFLHEGAVVPLTAVQFRRAHAEGVVELLAKRAVLRKLHEGKVGGELQRHAPTLLTGRFGRGAVERLHVFGDAVEIFFAFDVEREGVRGVQKVFTELLREKRETFADFLHAGALIVGEIRTRQAEVTQVALENALTDGREFGKGVGRAKRLVALVETRIERNAKEEFRDAREFAVVGVAKFGRVAHALQVSHHAPGARQTAERLVQGFDHVLPGRRTRSVEHLLERLFHVFGERRDGGRHVFGTNGGVVNEIGDGQKRIVASSHVYLSISKLGLRGRTGARRTALRRENGVGEEHGDRHGTDAARNGRDG